MYAYIDRKKKFPVTTLLRALGFSSDEEIWRFSTFRSKSLKRI
jgi:DNA-directed RNA polymerase subunit beta